MFCAGVQDVLCSENFGAVPRDEQTAVWVSAVSVAEENDKETKIKDELEESGLHELDFGAAKDIWRGLRDIVAVRGRRRELRGGWNVAEEGEVFGDAESSKELGKFEESDVKGVGGDGGRYERDDGPVVVDLGETDEGVSSGGEGVVADDIVRKGLHDGGFDDGSGLFPKDCSHGVSRYGGL